ncbi:T9SS type A sorting domain-containing protein [Plebeiibacterium sediminum]|uniref:T9SS type A sorting domain-containing protein n=1 Tax=Plebeiibacterium sediminum TaxID=2992112 RepID=A0AAE3SGK2_9BACT|nr:T9SS type A sorting domain-containing protein [Plebeiobacterium sediminum]MCW3787383.1 T9SS type A sorting domain-containing protein [Plebeiobacterium sediminum]
MKRSLLVLLMVFTSVFCFSQAESDILKRLFIGPEELVKQSEELISLSVDAVWYASGVTGYTTTTGTLTQNTSNYDLWTYSASPNDKMVLNYANGDVIEFIFTEIDGFVNGDEEDFKLSHAMDFTSYISGQMNLRIQSQTGPQNDRIEWSRVITGTTTIDNTSFTVNIVNDGYKNVVNEHGIALGDFYNETSGTVMESTTTYNINESYFTQIGHNSNQGIYVQSRQIKNSNSASGTFGTYQYSNVDCFWVGGTSLYEDAYEGVYNEVIENYNWMAQGSIFKNDEYYGSVIYDRPIVNYTRGAYIIADCNGGIKYNLYPALIPTALSVQSNEYAANTTLSLYPNPATSTVNILFDIPVASKVELVLFNQNGTRVKTLVSENKVAGENAIDWPINDLPSGVYLLQISTAQTKITQKLVKL